MKPQVRLREHWLERSAAKTCGLRHLRLKPDARANETRSPAALRRLRDFRPTFLTTVARRERLGKRSTQLYALARLRSTTRPSPTLQSQSDMPCSSWFTSCSKLTSKRSISLEETRARG